MITQMCVQVTKEDIKNGVQGSCRLCPIAGAVNRIVSPIKPDYVVLVDPHDGISIERPGHGNPYYERTVEGWSIQLPVEAVRFIHNFDSGNPLIRPFNFKAGGVENVWE